MLCRIYTIYLGVQMEKRNPRSSSYQHLLVETSCSNEMMEAFCNEDSIYNRLNPFGYSEDILELDDLLKVEFWRIVKTCLTNRQRKVLELYTEGFTQMEIAKKLKINQSSINKSIRGNVNYMETGKKHVYGGTIRKIQKILETDEKIKEILKKMDEVRSEKW